MALQCLHTNVGTIVSNQACILSLLVLIAATPAAAAPMSATGGIVPHEAMLSGLVVEHADIVSGVQGVPARAYLTIYNAGAADRRIMAISADGFSTPIVKRRDAGVYETLTVVDAFLVIPRQAELFMAADSLFLEMNETLDVAGERMMSVTFDDGDIQTVPVTVHPPGGVRTAHHHGIGDFE
jgi:copper(I)-binding protein